MRWRSSARISSGAVEMRLRIWLRVWARDLRAEDRATRRTRMASTFPSLVLASPWALDAGQLDLTEAERPTQQLAIALWCRVDRLDC